MVTDEEVLLMKASRERLVTDISEAYQLAASLEETELLPRLLQLHNKASAIPCDHKVDHYKLQIAGYELSKMTQHLRTIKTKGVR